MYLSRAPISLVTFSDVWITMMGFDSTGDRSICSTSRCLGQKYDVDKVF